MTFSKIIAEKDSNNRSYSINDCMELYKKSGKDSLPKTCVPYVSHFEKQAHAWAGAPFADRVAGTTATANGSSSEPILNRRFTSTNNHSATGGAK